MEGNRHIRIFQPIVPEYRKALFDGLAERYGNNIEIWAAERMGGDASVALDKMQYDYSHSFKRIGPFLWQRGLKLRGLSKGDVIVICGDIHQLSSLWIAIKAKIRGIRVIWWGHHVSALAKESRVGLRLWIARHLSDVYLCYTDAGIDYLSKRGFRRVYATGNTIDLDAVEQAVQDWSAERLMSFKKEHGLFGKQVLLFCGVLREKVRVDILLKAFAKLAESIRDLHLVVIGAGAMQEQWKALGGQLGIDDRVTWPGELRGQERLAPWFLSAKLFVYPGRIGLSLIHAFSFGLPVVLNDNPSNHGPEYVAFKPGVNGVSFRENDVDDLKSKIWESLTNDHLCEYGQVGRAFVSEHYSMKKMISRYSDAIESACRVGAKND